MVDRILHGRYSESLQREEGETPIGLVRRRYEASRDSAQNRVLAVREVSIRVENDLRRRWDAEHLALINGKVAFAQVAQRLAPGLRGSRASRPRCFVTRSIARLRGSRRFAPRSPRLLR